MNTFKKIELWKNERKKLAGNSIGFVPTMGALHEGHKSLIAKSLAENEITVVSIFVNPIQFDNPEDLEKYPDTLEEDKRILQEMGADYLFNPEYEDLYPDNFLYRIEETELSNKLCGAFRQGHFTGVLTVVMKLFNIVRPDKAYFGEKDYQQLQLIKGMTKAFFMDVEIVECPIVREKDGLAMSSRNLRLSEEDRKRAVFFPQLLASDLSDKKIASELRAKGFEVDYIETIDRRRFGAVYLGNVRLIDNVKK